MASDILKIEKRISADPTRLFRAWLKADDFARWFTSGDPVTERVSIDPRPGGRFRIEMTHKGRVLPHEGEYRTIEEPTKLVFTWRSHATGGLDTLVTVTFTALPPGPDAPDKPQTLVTLVHERLPNEASIRGHESGWTRILDGLEEWLAAGV